SLLTITLFSFFIATNSTDIYTLSLHDALPIYRAMVSLPSWKTAAPAILTIEHAERRKSPRASRWSSLRASQLPISAYTTTPRFQDRKSTRLNSSHVSISYAVFCLKKKKNCTDD